MTGAAARISIGSTRLNDNRLESRRKMRLKDKVAIITGSTSGIGRFTAERLAREGANVLVTGRNQEEGRKVERSLWALTKRQGNGGARFVAGDVANAADVKTIVEEAVRVWGQIDYLVNNAAMMTFDAIADLDDGDWDMILAVNLRAPFLLAKHCLPHMREGSAIVNVSSVHAAATTPSVVPYATTKGGLEAFTRGLAVELRERRIRVNAVRLGAIDTPMLWENPNVKSGREKIDPADVGRPQDIAEAILFLVSDLAAFTTGAILNVDGGRLARLG